MGIQGSAIEGSILDQVFSRPDETSVSTTQILAIAARQGQRLFAITSENVGSVLAQLGTSEAVKSDIAAAVAAGKVAIAPERDVVHRGFSGIGYLLLDPETGSGAFLLDGGSSGLSANTCQASAKPPSEPLSFEPSSSLGLAFLGFTGSVPPEVKELAERETKRILEKYAKRGLARAVAPLLIPGVGTVLLTALAVELTMDLVLIAYQIKLLIAEIGWAPDRTAEDLKCRCAENPTSAECACQARIEDQRPPLRLPAESPTEKRVEAHHLCANSTAFNEFRGVEVRLVPPEEAGAKSPERSFDVFSASQGQACEVKTSSYPDPAGPPRFIRGRWRERFGGDQIRDQARIAKRCGVSYCLIVNRQWLADDARDRAPPSTRVIVRPDCDTGGQPDHKEPNVFGLDR